MKTITRATLIAALEQKERDLLLTVKMQSVSFMDLAKTLSTHAAVVDTRLESKKASDSLLIQYLELRAQEARMSVFLKEITEHSATVRKSDDVLVRVGLLTRMNELYSAAINNAERSLSILDLSVTRPSAALATALPH